MAGARLNTSLLLALGAMVGLVAVMALAVSIGQTNAAIGDTTLSRLATVVYLLVSAGFAPAAYLLGALGLGRVVRPLLRPMLPMPRPIEGGARDERDEHGEHREARGFALDAWAVQLACGIGIMLTLSHLLGVLGLLDPGGLGRVIAIAPIGAGLILLAHQISSGERQAGAALPWTALLALPGVAVLLVASCSPPGWLWDSEFGGYDALSYHLQLPQEWLAMGRVWPVAHNVYSFLPGYVESAFVHLEVAGGYGSSPPLRGMIADGGTGLISAQLLHAGLTVCAGVIVGALTRRLALGGGLDRRSGALAGGLGASAVLLTPWSVVVGSLAYNEMAVVALGAGAVLVTGLSGMKPLARGALCGALVGCACGAKPTAIFMVGPAAGVFLLGMSGRMSGGMSGRVTGRGEWVRLIAGGALLGAVMLAPWLIRNAIASGNPVFPAMSGVFGSGHWSGDQTARFAREHGFDGPLLDRIRLMFVADATDPAGVRHRGLMHGQWSTVFIGVPLALAAGIGLVRARRVVWLLLIGLVVQVGAWLLLTHIQSRFLIPALVTAAPLLAIGGALAWRRRGETHDGESSDEDANKREHLAWVIARRVVVVAIGAPLVIAPLTTFAEQRGGRPNQWLVLGAAFRTGEIAFGASRQDQSTFLQSAPPTAWVNIALPSDEPVLMVGESAPLYYREPLSYATTWDTSPLARVIAEHPEPERWAPALLAEGYRLVLIDYNMLSRFHDSGAGDPRLDPERIARWLEIEAALVHAWPGVGQALYQLGRPGGGGQ